MAAAPSRVTFVPADFEVDSAPDSLTLRLVSYGFEPSRPAFVSWLGVMMYLTEVAIGAVLAELGALAPGTDS